MKDTGRKTPPQHSDFEIANKLHSGYCIFLVLAMLYSMVPKTWLSGLHGASAGLDILFAVMVFGFEIAYRSYQRKGEEIRRNILMDDSFGTRYFQLPAEGYYDNEGTESGVRKLLANIHQSAFYTSAISREMLRPRRIITVIWLLSAVLMLALGRNDSPVSLGALKLLLSYVIVGQYLALKHVHTESEKVCKDATSAWIYREEAGENDNFLSLALRTVMLYETAIAESRVLLDTRIKNRLNRRLETSWHDLRTRYKMEAEQQQNRQFPQ
jgi:hypothetical protein